MKIRLLVVIVILATALNSLSCAQAQEKNNSDNDKIAKINELVSLYNEYGGFNGAVLVAHKGEVLYKKGFGNANMEWEIPNQTDTKFRLASITKPFTALLTMQLVQEGKLDLHEPIATYLPDYPKENGTKITIHHILSHTSGIPNDYPSEDKLNRFPGKHRISNLVKVFSHLPLDFKPGERFSYSNSGFMVLGLILETVTKQPYGVLLKQKILDPLGMKNTGIDKHRPIIKYRAKGYFENFGNYYNSNYIDMSSIPAVGNMYSTVEDLYILDQALYDEKLLSKKYLNLMFTMHIDDPDYGGHHGYGWELRPRNLGNTTKTIATIGHSGSIDGFCSLFTRISSTNSSIIFLNNTKRAFLNRMTTAITGILNDETYDFPLKPLAMFMDRVIQKEGLDKGIQFFKAHKDDKAYYVSEQELIVAGYKLLHAENAIDAAKIFKLSIEVFPDRDNPYDSYAEALMALGKNEEAIINYKKSLELNPNNNNAIKMLEILNNEAIND